MSRLDELRKLSTNARTGHTNISNACAVVGLDKYVECYDRLCRNCIFHTETYRRVTSLEETIELVDELVSPAQEPPLAASMRKNLV